MITIQNLSKKYTDVAVLDIDHLAALGITYSFNFLNIFLNNSDKVFYPVVALVVLAGFAQYYGFFDLTVYTAPIFDF